MFKKMIVRLIGVGLIAASLLVFVIPIALPDIFGGGTTKEATTTVIYFAYAAFPTGMILIVFSILWEDIRRWLKKIAKGLATIFFDSLGLAMIAAVSGIVFIIFAVATNNLKMPQSNRLSYGIMLTGIIVTSYGFLNFPKPISLTIFVGLVIVLLGGKMNPHFAFQKD